MEPDDYIRRLLAERLGALDEVRAAAPVDDADAAERQVREIAGLYLHEIRAVIFAFSDVGVIDRTLARRWLDESRNEFTERGLGPFYKIIKPNGPPVDI